MKQFVVLMALLLLAGCTSRPPANGPGTKPDESKNAPANTPPSTPPSTTPSTPPSTPPSTTPSTPPSTPPSTTPSTPPTTPVNPAPSKPADTRGAATPPGLYPPDKRTGTAEVDRVLDAVAKRDVDALVALALMSQVPCTTQTGGMNDRPVCEGKAEGTPIETMPGPGCEPFNMYTMAIVRANVKTLLSRPQYVYTVYKARDRVGEHAAAYAIGFAADMQDEKALTLYLDSKGSLVRIRGGCGGPATLVPADAEFILPPQRRQ